MYIQCIYIYIWCIFGSKDINDVFFDVCHILSTQDIACLFGRLGRHEAREQIRLGGEESLAPEFPQVSLLHDISQRKLLHWAIVARTDLEFD